MQEDSAENFRADKQAESAENNMAADGDTSEMEEWEGEESPSATKSKCHFCLRRRRCHLRYSATPKGTTRGLGLSHADCASAALITRNPTDMLPDTFSPLTGLWTHRVSSEPSTFPCSRTCVPHSTVPALSSIRPQFTSLPPLTSVSTSLALYLCLLPGTYRPLNLPLAP